MKNGKKYNVPVSLNGEGLKSQVKLELAKKRIIARKRARKIKDIYHITMVVALMFLIVFVLVLYNSPKTHANNSNAVKTTIKRNNRTYSVQIFRDRVSTMRHLWYSPTRILDLLAIMNMECGSYKWDCFNWNDIWPMQINKIHKEQYNKSWEFYNNKDWGGLFTYQLKYANQLLDSYEKRFCSADIFKQVGKTYTNKARWECIWKSYNGHFRHKYAYVKLWWLRRQTISNLIFKKG